MPGEAAGLETMRALISAVGLVGAWLVWWPAGRVWWRYRATSGPLAVISASHVMRATTLLVVNGALLASALASRGLSAPQGEPWQAWTRVGAIALVSAVVALAPWCEHYWRAQLVRTLTTPAGRRRVDVLAEDG